MTSKPQLCFIGVGNMGNPMAENLLKAGFPMTVFDFNKDKAQNLISLGAKWSPSIAEGVANAHVIMTSLPGPAQVEDVMFSQSGVLEHIKPSATIIDTSTSSVELAQRLFRTAISKNAYYLEAPVTNAVDFAALGRLSIFVGGAEDCFKRHQSIFEVIGEKIFYVGPAGNGATIKLLTNLLWFVSAAAIGEGLMLGAKAGIPLDTVWAAIKSSAGNSWVAEHDVPSIFAGHYDPSFSLALCCKDLNLINEIAKQQGYSLTMGALAQSLFADAMAKYGESAGELHVARLLEERVGLLLRPPLGIPLTTPDSKNHLK